MTNADKPVLQHDWWDPAERFPNLRLTDSAGNPVLSCRACGLNLLRDRTNEQAACRGVVHVKLRGKQP